MKPLDPAPGSGHMRVNGHLPFSWKVLKEEEADRVRSQILDNAVARSWTVRPESHLNVSEEMGPLMRRLNEIEEKIDRLLLRLDRADAPPLPTRALTLGTESCILTALPDEVFPPGRAVGRNPIHSPSPHGGRNSGIGPVEGQRDL